MVEREKQNISFTKILLSAVLLIVVLFIFGGGSLYWGIQRGLRHRTESLASDGHPTTMAELDNVFGRLPEELDTTQLWLDAYSMLEQAHFGDRHSKLYDLMPANHNYPSIDESWEGWDIAETLVDDIEPALMKAYEAEAKGGQAKFSTDYSSAEFPSIDELTRLRNFARAAKLASIVYARRRDTVRAGMALRTLSVTSEPFRNEPTLVSQLVRIAVIGIDVSSMHEMVRRIQIPESDLQCIQQRSREFDPKIVIRAGVDGERAYNLDALKGKFKDAKPSSFSIPGEASLLLKYYEGLDEFQSIPIHQWVDRVNQNEDDFQRYIGARPWRHLQKHNIELLRPSLNSFIGSVVSVASQMRLRDAMIACELFRRENDQWPTGLEELVPKFLPSIPDDPFTGEPIRMIVDDEGLTLYSVGKDRIDNGGKREQEESFENEPSFHLPPANQMPP